MNVLTRTGSSCPDGAGAYPEPHTGEAIVDALDSVMTALREELSRLAHCTGLPAPAAELRLLMVISHHDGITVNELARQFGRAKSQVSAVAARLVAEGDVVRDADPADRRLVRLTATDDGRRRAALWQNSYRGMLARTIRSLSEDEADHLLHGLLALRGALGNATATGDAA